MTSNLHRPLAAPMDRQTSKEWAHVNYLALSNPLFQSRDPEAPRPSTPYEAFDHQIRALVNDRTNQFRPVQKALSKRRHHARIGACIQHRGYQCLPRGLRPARVDEAEEKAERLRAERGVYHPWLSPWAAHHFDRNHPSVIQRRYLKPLASRAQNMDGGPNPRCKGCLVCMEARHHDANVRREQILKAAQQLRNL